MYFEKDKAKEGDAGEEAGGSVLPVEAPMTESEKLERAKKSGPPPGWRAGYIAVSAAGIRQEAVEGAEGIPDCFDKLAIEDPEVPNNIIRGIT